MKRLLPLLGLFLAFALPAAASNCPSFPYTLTNGQTADANQVMANFNSLLNCANTTLLTAPVTGSSIASSTITASNIASGTLTSSQISTSGGVGLLGTAGTWTAGATYLSFGDIYYASRSGTLVGTKSGTGYTISAAGTCTGGTGSST